MIKIALMRSPTMHIAPPHAEPLADGAASAGLCEDAVRRPTVCQLLHGLGVGGAEVLAARMARQLGCRFRFVFACLDETGPLGDQLRRDGFVVHQLQRRSGIDWRCSRKLAELVAAERPEILHAHQYTPFFYAALARFWRGGPPLLFTEHGRWFPDYPRKKRILANRLLLRRRDRVVGVGQAVRQALIENEGIRPDRVGVIYNGIDLSAFGGAHDRLDVRREIDCGPADLVILQVARLDGLKDHATAVRTVERIARQRPDARLVMVGEGPELPGIQALVRERQLNSLVRFLGLRTDVPRLLRAADVVLLTSKSEGIPLTLIEGMAASRPVVSTRVGGVAEVVEDGRTGLLAPAGDDAALARAVLRLAADPVRAGEMGRAGRQRAQRLFGEQAMHDAYARLYKEMLHG